MLSGHPRNVRAIRQWYKDNNPSNLETFDIVLAKSGANDRFAEAMLALALQGFEAGREFQRNNPTCDSGPGYMEAPRREEYSTDSKYLDAVVRAKGR